MSERSEPAPEAGQSAAAAAVPAGDAVPAGNVLSAGDAVPDVAKRRRQALAGAFAGLAVVGVLLTTLILSGTGDPADTSGAPATAPPAGAPVPTGPAATAPIPQEPASPAFPLPDGADPALGRKPAAGAGSGQLTELTVTPLIRGTGAPAQVGRGILVNYVGVLYTTGEQFDASWDRGEPFSFQLGTGSVIPGWDQGLVGVRVGSRVQLDIPANLAYGDNPGGGRPAGPLRFIVDVLAVQ